VELAYVLECPDFKVQSSPVHHMIPTIGIRVECRNGNKVLAYSCDTEPCEQTVRLASGADILIHEAGGASFGHSSAEQAGEIATKAEVGTLYLIHYPTGRFANGDLAAEARKTYQGEVLLAQDFMTIEL
jgi:ribonuclease BN (tRNA processing enzyme)